MRLKSLNFQIFKLILGLLLFTALGILVSVWTNTNQHAEKQLKKNLVLAENVFQQLLESREQQLFSSADILTSDFGFKQAIATQDKATIESVLQNHGDRIEADIMAVISLSNEVVASTTPALISGKPFPDQNIMRQVFSDGGASSLMIFEDKLYQVIMLTINAPTPIAATLLAFEMDQQLLKRLKVITKLENTISAFKHEKRLLSISTLSEAAALDALTNVDNQISWFSIYFLSESALVSRQFIVQNQQDMLIVVTLTEDMSAIFQEFYNLQANISIIALFAVMLALVFAYVLANKLSRPLISLAKIAKRISLGQYHQKLHETSQLKEVRHLSDAFETMQDNIQAREDKIIFQANHDLLTKLNNRFYIEQVLLEHLTSSISFQVVGINIFAFRNINDVFGYQNGDLCLKHIANALKKLGGQSARLTGGELLWLPDKALSITELKRIKSTLEAPLINDEVTIRPKLVFGVLTCPDDAQSLEVFFKRLNIVLDEAKKSEDKLLSFQPAFEEKYIRRLTVVTELKRALVKSDSEFRLFYQPKLSIWENKVQHVEALIRWNNDILGFVSPEEFITLAEQAGIINQVTDWVVKQAIIDAKYIQQQGIDICIAINLSAHDIANPRLLPNVLAHLENYQVAKTCLSFEITESDLVEDPVHAIAEMKRYREQGFALAIDDFGTGYSSLEYLKNLPVTALKIDKSFVLNLASETSDQSIVQTVIKLAHQFGLSVIAEGIEEQKALELLQLWQCEYAQGYHISRPIPLAELIAWHQQHQQHQWLSV